MANISTNVFLQNPINKFICDICDFKCSNKYNYVQHNTTAKHQKLIMANMFTLQNAGKCNFLPTQIPTQIPKQNLCYCGKEYKHRSSLSKHKKTCKFIGENIGSNTIIDSNDTSNDTSNDISVDVILKILQENTDIKELMVKQFETMQHQQKTLETQQKTLETQQKQIGELIPLVGNTTTVNNTNNTNNKFNINIFLNEQCHNAINMNDFIKQINISLEDLDITKNQGLTEGLSNLLIANMNKLSVYERPVHCTDIKRETLYIKDQDGWEKDQDKTKMKAALKDLTKIQYRNMQQWMDANPGYMDDPDKQDYFIDLVRRCSSSLEDIDSKVIKRVCNNVNIKDDLINETKLL